jgi:hypothetical protein
MDNLPSTQTTGLALYETACLALSVAMRTDEVKDIRDKAEAMRAYAHQAKNRQMEIDAAEIRIRAERRLGELIVAQKETVGLNAGMAGGAARDASGTFSAPLDARPTLADVGIDKKLSAHAQKVAAIPEAEFEGIVGEWRETLEAANDRVTTNIIKAAKQHEPRPAAPNVIDIVEPAHSEADQLRAEIAELRDQLAELASQYEEVVADNASMAEVLEANDKVAEALAEAKKYRELYRIEKERSNSLLHEKNAAVRAAKSWQRKAGAL